MVEAIAVGGFLIPTRPLSLLLAVVAAMLATKFLAARKGLDGKWAVAVIEGGALAGLVAARLVFITLNPEIYSDAPWTALYLWQPGYYPWAGVLFALVYACWRLRQRGRAQGLAYVKVLGLGTGMGLGVLLGAYVLLTLGQRPGILRPGDQVPDFQMMSLKGESVRLGDFTGRAMILNFWATWCPPCRREMPLLDSMSGQYADRGLVIVGINLSEPKDRVAEFIGRVSVRYSIWVDAPAASVSSRELFQRFGGVGLPTTIFIDRSGRISDIYVGELNRAKLQTVADELTAPDGVQASGVAPAGKG